MRYENRKSFIINKSMADATQNLDFGSIGRDRAEQVRQNDAQRANEQQELKPSSLSGTRLQERLDVIDKKLQVEKLAKQAEAEKRAQPRITPEMTADRLSGITQQPLTTEERLEGVAQATNETVNDKIDRWNREREERQKLQEKKDATPLGSETATSSVQSEPIPAVPPREYGAGWKGQRTPFDWEKSNQAAPDTTQASGESLDVTSMPASESTAQELDLSKIPTEDLITEINRRNEEAVKKENVAGAGASAETPASQPITPVTPTPAAVGSAEESGEKVANEPGVQKDKPEVGAEANNKKDIESGTNRLKKIGKNLIKLFSWRKKLAESPDNPKSNQAKKKDFLSSLKNFDDRAMELVINVTQAFADSTDKISGGSFTRLADQVSRLQAKTKIGWDREKMPRVVEEIMKTPLRPLGYVPAAVELGINKLKRKKNVISQPSTPLSPDGQENVE